MRKALAMVASGVAVLASAACEAPVEAGGNAASNAEHVVTSEFSQELHDALPTDIRDKGTISVAGEANQPWRIVAPDGSVTGFQADILAEFSAILGVEFTSDMVGGLPAVKLGVQSGRNDIGFGPLLDNAATRSDLLFIDYTVGRPSFLYPDDGDEITEALEICGRTLGVLEGSAAFDKFLASFDVACAEAGRAPVTRISLADINGLLLAVQSNRIDVAGMGAHQAVYAVSQNPDKFRRYISTNAEWPPDQLGMGFDPSDAELANVMYEVWKRVFESGVYDELMAKYDLTEIAVDRPLLHAEAGNK